MLTKEDYEYLKNLPHLGSPFDILNFKNVWYTSDDTIIIVARILNRYGIFPSIDSAIDFFESPRKRERDIQDLIKEYEREVKAHAQRRQSPQ